jgi:hypothetical protein
VEVSKGAPFCLTELEEDHLSSEFFMKFYAAGFGEGELVEVRLYQTPQENGQRGITATATSANLSIAHNHVEIKHTFEQNHTYEICLEPNSDKTKSVFFEFPTITMESMGSKSELEDGIQMIRSLAAEVTKTSENVNEVISRTVVFDRVYDEMETSLHHSLLIKGGVLLLVCVLQGWVFMSMIGKKVFEYTRISIPI